MAQALETMERTSRMETVTFESPPSRDSDLLRSLWHRKLFVALWAALGLGASLLYCALAAPEYESKAQLLVVKKQAGNAPMLGVNAQLSYLDDYLSSHEALIKSPLIVDEAVKRANLQSLRTFAGEADSTKLIIESLTARRDTKGSTERSNAVLDLSYRGAVADECSIILSAVIDSYKEYLDKTHQIDRETIRTLFTQWRDEVQTQLVQKQAEYQELRDESPSYSLKGPDGVAHSQGRLTTLEAQSLAYMVRRTEAEKQLAAIESAKKNGVSPGVLMEMVSKWRTTGPDTKLQDQLTALLLEQQTLSQRYGSKHPEILAVQRRIDMIEGRISSDDNVLPNQVNPVALHIEVLKQEVQVTVGVEASLSELLTKEHAVARKANAHREDMDELRSDIASLRELYKELVKQLQGVDLLKDSRLYHAEVIAPPEAGFKVAPNPKLIVSIASFLGILIGAGLALLKESSSQESRDAALA